MTQVTNLLVVEWGPDLHVGGGLLDGGIGDEDALVSLARGALDRDSLECNRLDHASRDSSHCD
jgi:hypothetical protein